MSKHEFDTDDTSRYTLTAFLSFVIILVIFLSVSRCHGDYYPKAAINNPSDARQQQ